MDLTSTHENKTVAPTIVESKDDFQSLDPRQIRVDQIASLIFTAVVGVGALVGLVVFAIAGGGVGTVWLIVVGAAAVVFTLLFVAAIFWPRLEYRYAKWRLDETGLQILRGVLWRHQISVPIARVQHADVSQGPLQRHFELGTLTIHTAGTQNASIALSGLAHVTAIELRDEVVHQRKAVDVV